MPLNIGEFYGNRLIDSYDLHNDVNKNVSNISYIFFHPLG